MSCVLRITFGIAVVAWLQSIYCTSSYLYTENKNVVIHIYLSILQTFIINCYQMMYAISKHSRAGACSNILCTVVKRPISSPVIYPFIGVIRTRSTRVNITLREGKLWLMSLIERNWWYGTVAEVYSVDHSGNEVPSNSVCIFCTCSMYVPSCFSHQINNTPAGDVNIRVRHFLHFVVYMTEMLREEQSWNCSCWNNVSTISSVLGLSIYNTWPI